MDEFIDALKHGSFFAWGLVLFASAYIIAMIVFARPSRNSVVTSKRERENA